jgi:cysteinyl-tRNA synthetase
MAARQIGRMLALAALLASAPMPAMGQAPQSDAREALRKARSWGYQLQNIDPRRLFPAPQDVLVLDGLSVGKATLAALKRKKDGSRRVVLAYVNIGEAEDYRYYWKAAWAKSPPEWLGSANCRWKGDHRVRFWMAAWREILTGARDPYLGRLVDAGFDGMFLDRVDIHRFWLKENPQATAEMVRFVAELARWTRERKPGFLVVPQNGEELLANDSYLDLIDAQAKEDLLFGDRGNDVANSDQRRERAAGLIARVKAAGKPVFVVEYIKRPDNLALAKEKLEELGFIGTYTGRSLSWLGLGGPPHPDDRDTEPIMADDGSGGCK